MMTATLRLLALQGGYCRPVGSGNRVKRFAGFHFVMDDCDLASCLESISADLVAGGFVVAVSVGLRCFVFVRDGGRFGVVSAGRNRQMQGQHSASAKAVAMNSVPPAQHLRRDAEVFGDGLDRVSGMNFVSGDTAGVGRIVAAGCLPGATGMTSLASASSSVPSRWLASEIGLAVV